MDHTFHGLMLIWGQGILRAVGMGGGVAAAGVVETSDLLDLWKQVTEHLGFV